MLSVVLAYVSAVTVNETLEQERGPKMPGLITRVLLLCWSKWMVGLEQKSKSPARRSPPSQVA